MAAGSPAPAGSRFRPRRLLSPAIGGRVLVLAGRAGPRRGSGGRGAPGDPRERGDRVRAAAWSCCGAAGRPLRGPGRRGQAGPRRRGDLGFGGGVAAAATSSCRAWFQACSPNGAGAVRRCFQVAVSQPPWWWLRIQIRENVLRVRSALRHSPFVVGAAVLAAPRSVAVELAAVVGPQADLDAVGVDHPPALPGAARRSPRG